MRRPEFFKSCSQRFVGLAAVLLAASFLGPQNAAADADSPSHQSRPNVVLIITDQQFGEALSCRMGTQYLRTPAMDSLAASGMFFTRAFAANPLCMPSRAAIFSGRYPHETRVTSNASKRPDTSNCVCMGTYFRRSGYETAYFGKWHLCYDPDKVETHGFEVCDQSKRDANVTAAAVEFISKKRDKPFLLVTSFLNPHNICEYARGQSLSNGPIGNPPPLEQCPPAPANLAPPLNEPDTMTTLRKAYHANKLFPVGDFTVERWRRLRWGYYRLIEKVDGEIGKVIAALHRIGLEDNTLIVFTSDHGECAGAHGFNQKTVFYEESVRVPLIVSYKGKTSVGTTDRLVNTGIDILPSLLDFASIDVPTKLPGRSLRLLALGEPATEWRDHIVIENNMSQAGTVDGMTPQADGRMIRTDHYKYCVYSRGIRRESLVDLQKDPGETRDLAGDPAHRKVLLEYRGLLEKFGRQHNDPLVAELLADDVKPRPFTAESPKKPKESKKKRSKK